MYFYLFLHILLLAYFTKLYDFHSLSIKHNNYYYYYIDSKSYPGEYPQVEHICLACVRPMGRCAQYGLPGKQLSIDRCLDSLTFLRTHSTKS